MSAPKEQTPGWLSELQLKSWEPEILLSGIVLYGMFQVPDLLDRFKIFFETSVVGEDSNVELLVNFMKIGVSWLIGGLILHLISRGIWVGMVGLSYTFPNGINSVRLKYKEPFQGRIKRIPGYQRTIIRLENISSSLFALSFLLFMVNLGVYLYLLFFLVIPDYIVEDLIDVRDGTIGEKAFNIYVLVILGLGFINIIDFITLGFFRRFRLFAKIYWPWYRLISLLTLSRFYRSIYYGLISNTNRWFIFLFFVAFSISCILGLSAESDGRYPGDSISNIDLWTDSFGYSAYSGYYDDQNEGKYSIRASIPSDIIDENVLRLFIPANVSYEDSVLAYAKKEPFKKELDSLKGNTFRIAAIKNYYKVFLDDSLINELPLKFHYKTSTRQKGYLIYLDIAGLERGMHELSVKRRYGKTRMLDMAVIPFFRDDSYAEDAQDTSELSKEDYLKIKSLLGK
jgi:hypothetical protein